MNIMVAAVIRLSTVEFDYRFSLTAIKLDCQDLHTLMSDAGVLH